MSIFLQIHTSIWKYTQVCAKTCARMCFFKSSCDLCKQMIVQMFARVFQAEDMHFVHVLYVQECANIFCAKYLLCKVSFVQSIFCASTCLFNGAAGVPCLVYAFCAGMGNPLLGGLGHFFVHVQMDNVLF